MKQFNFKSLYALVVLLYGSAALSKSISKVRITGRDNPIPDRIHILPYIAEEHNRDEVSQTPGVTLSGVTSVSARKGWQPDQVFQFDIEPIIITPHPHYSELEIVYGCAVGDVRRYFMQDDIAKLAENSVLVINLDDWEEGITLEAVN